MSYNLTTCTAGYFVRREDGTGSYWYAHGIVFGGENRWRMKHGKPVWRLSIE